MGATRGIVLLMALSCVARAQYNTQPTQVPILKQIDRHNEDGSYSYGYEGADGSFKIETKHATGEVYGKYGYVDDSGKLREVEYGASRRGFEPAGTGINVPPPTISNNNYNNYVGNDGYDDGQYREDPTKYYKTSSSGFYRPPQKTYNNPPPQQQHYNPPPQQHYNSAPQQHHYNPPPQQQHYNPPPQQNYYNAPRPHTPIDPNIFRGHPATNFNVESGSYSINYSG